MGTAKVKKRRGRSLAKTEWRSGFEKKIRDDLEKRGIKYQYEPDKFRIFLPAVGHFCPKCSNTKILRTSHYIPDFKFGDSTYVEAKGKLDARARRAILAFKTQYPQHKLYVLFQRDNWMTKTRKRRYTDWCAENGVGNAVGTSIPDWMIRAKAEAV